MNSANYDTETCSIDVLYQIVPIGHLKFFQDVVHLFRNRYRVACKNGLCHRTKFSWPI